MSIAGEMTNLYNGGLTPYGPRKASSRIGHGRIHTPWTPPVKDGPPVKTFDEVVRESGLYPNLYPPIDVASDE